jgi:hypothetical protein
MLAARRAPTPLEPKGRGVVLDDVLARRSRVVAAYVADLTGAPEHAEPATS